MTIIELFDESQQDDSKCLEYTGMNQAQLKALTLVPDLKLTTANHLTVPQKLFAVLYAETKQLNATAVGRLLSFVNCKRDGETFLKQGVAALTLARQALAVAMPLPKSIAKVNIASGAASSTTKAVKSMLGLPAGDMIKDAKSTMITHAPMNSSGDIYHILAFLILIMSMKMKVPKVMLTHDDEGTKKQAQRSLNFANALGFSSFFSMKKIPSKGCSQPNPRQTSLEQHLQQHHSDVVYVDQMATTTLIASLFLKHGFESITSLLRKGFAKTDARYYPQAAQEQVSQYVRDQLAPVKQADLKKPILVLHLRHSKTSNHEQNLPDDLVLGLIGFLSAKGYDAWCILADDRKKKKSFAGSCYTTFPFQTPVIHQEIDYAKFQHLNLMQHLAKLENIKGVIGNTSGTLDLAAFVGNRVYNIHQFNAKISYQSLRLCMQMTFLSVDDLKSKKQKSSEEWRANHYQALKDALPELDHWLNKQTVGPAVQEDNFKIKKTKAGFKKMFQIQSQGKSFPLVEIAELEQALTHYISGKDKQSLLARLPAQPPEPSLNARPSSGMEI